MVKNTSKLEINPLHLAGGVLSGVEGGRVREGIEIQ